MKTRFAILLFAATLTTAAHVRAETVLPDACGSDKVKFDVETKKKQPAPAPPADGKAQIIFIELTPSSSPTIRFGVDGAWVGATKGNSYFAVSVDPGVHHLCAGWQSHFSKLENQIGVTSFTAEAGKIYYYEYNISVMMTGGSPGMMVGSPSTGGQHEVGGSAPVSNVSTGLVLVSEDDGKFRVKASPVAIGTPQK